MKNIEMPYRRTFLTSALVALTACGSNSDNPKKSFKELAARGLPKEFSDLGFRIGEYKNKNTEREVLVIGEHHNESSLDKERVFIDFLVKEFGVQCMLFEGSYGQNSRSNDYSHAINEYVGDKLSKKYEFTDFKFYFAGIEDHFLQKGIPCFGLEDKILRIRVDMLKIIWGSLANVAIARLQNTPYDKIQGYDRIEKFINDLAEGLPNEKLLPRGNIRTALDDGFVTTTRDRAVPTHEGALAANGQPVTFANPKLRQLIEEYNDLVCDERTEAFAKNIQSAMDKTGANKAVALMGAGHAGYFKDRKNVQDILNISSLAVYIEK